MKLDKSPSPDAAVDEDGLCVSPDKVAFEAVCELVVFDVDAG